MNNNIVYDKIRDFREHIYFTKNVSGKNGSKVVLHNHHAIELKFFVGGKCTVHVGNERFDCKEGDMIFVNSRRPHCYESTDASENYVLVVSQDMFKSICPKGKAFPIYMPNGDNFKYVRRILEETYPVWRTMSLNAQRGFVYRILGTIMQYNKLIDIQYDKKEELAVQILEYVELHYNEDIKLEDLAKKFGYTPNYFSNMFNKYFHMGLRECINRSRIKKAVEMISSNPKLPLANIAEACGYDSLNTFHRAYKKFAKEKFTIDF